jgi:hypothetical protein
MKKIAAIATFAAVLVLVIFQLVISKKVNRTSTVPIPGKAKETALSTPTSSPISNKEYNDEAGYKFSYPGDLVLTPQTNLDANTYSWLRLTSTANKGSIMVKIYDSPARIKEELGESTTIKLADLAAKKVTAADKIIVLAREGNTLYQIEAQTTGNDAYWLTALNKIVSSFAFVTPTSAASGVNNSTNSDSTDVSTPVEEEIVE